MSRWIETAALEIKNRFAPRGRAPGQLMIMFAFGIVSMIGCLAMVVDVGMLMNTRRGYQKIADTCASPECGPD